MTIAAANYGRQRTPTDGLPQATNAASLEAAVGTWVRDEEVSTSGESEAGGRLTELR
jgi:hypothetical protein